MTKISGLTLLAITAFATFLSFSISARSQEASLDTLRSDFAHPPPDARIMMRWWWFGPAVTKPEIQRELETMKAAGIGGVEIQPVYPMELNDTQTGFRNLPFLSPDFLSALRFAAVTARNLGMRVDLTLGSGWPYGGSYVPINEAAACLRFVVNPLSQGSMPVPSLRNGEQLLAVFTAPGTPDHYDATKARQIAGLQKISKQDGRITLAANAPGPHVAMFFILSRTGQMVKRAAVGAEGFVIDPFSQAAVEDHLRTIGEPLLEAFDGHPPFSVFSDSLEVYGSDWTSDLLPEFHKRRGYDLTPYLPALIADAGPQTNDVRYDWGRTLKELIEEHYLHTIGEWAGAHHTKFRSQTYGTSAVTLSSSRLVDLPEGEGPQWRGFSYTRWITSASHLYGRPITSSESWTWLHSPAFRATPLDMKAEADTFFLQGVNQLVGHGWPYSPESAGDPGWSFYAAAVFNQHNPWWIVMPEITTYLQRTSYVMRLGKPANNVAILLPTEDAQSRFKPGHVSVTDEMESLLPKDLVPALLDSGYGFDFIDSEAILRQGIAYKILLLPGVERLPLNAYRRITDYARAGGIVISVGKTPSAAPGLKEAGTESKEVQAISRSLFSPGTKTTRSLSQASDLSAALVSYLQPDVKVSPQNPAIGFVERKLANADIYFLANTGNQPRSFQARFNTKKTHVECWDPFTGKASYIGLGPTLQLKLAAYESRILVFSDEAQSDHELGRALAPRPLPAAVDISDHWTVTFDKIGLTEPMQTLHSWADDDKTRYYSGTATYRREIDLPAGYANAPRVLLDFGPGTPIPQVVRKYGTQAWIDAPVREAALIYVNGNSAGSVWRPPYAIDIAAWLKPGKNELKIVVANTAINELSGRAAPDYRLLTSRYGERFVPQDQDHLSPLPSGIFPTLRLVPKHAEAPPDAMH